MKPISHLTPEYLAKCLQTEKKDSVEATSALLDTLSPQSLAQRGLAMLNLLQLSTCTGYGGRIVLELGPDPSISSDWNPCFRVGDIVRVDSQPKSSQKTGNKGKKADPVAKEQTDESDRGGHAVVVAVGKQSLSVAYESEDSNSLPDGKRLWIAKLENEAVFNRMNWAIERLLKAPHGIVAQLMLGETTAQVSQTSEKVIGSHLNETQAEAVRYALGSNLCVIHGPPGTGKTGTVVEIIKQLVAKGERVLVCGPSNVSVDNIVERLSPDFSRNPQELLRLGHPARSSETALRHSADLLMKSSNEGQVIKDLQREITDTLSQALGRSRTKLSGGKREAFKLLKDLRKDYRSRESRLMHALLLGSKVVAATLHTAGSKEVGGAAPLFDTLIIDEVSQAMLPQCYIPAVIDNGIKRLIVAGDNRQLPPTVTSKDPKVLGALQMTLFDMLIHHHGPDIHHLISIQYRMNAQIMEFPSSAIYENKLTADPSIADKTLEDLPYICSKGEGTSDQSLLSSKVVWIDTAPVDSGYLEQREEDGFSIKNEGEATLVEQYVMKLLDSGIKPQDIGVIAPYNAQIGLLRVLIANSDIEISTVDGFQGREKEVIILSLVRNNERNDVGFLSDDRRINVALTRPKKQLCIVGNTEMLSRSNSTFLKKWATWCGDNADIEYAD